MANERVPDQRLDFPIQRFFSGNPQSRRSDQYARLERRVRDLEATYSLKTFQHGFAEVSAVAEITDNRTQPAPDEGGPRVTVRVPSIEALIVIYYEFDVRITGASTTSKIYGDIYESNNLAQTVELARYDDVPPGSYNLALTPGDSDLNATGPSGQGRSPRGRRRMVSYIDPGDRTFELRYRHLAAGGAGTEQAYVQNAKLWVDVV